jgi:3-hydroxybutyryl-CoA dehydrogenase
MGAGIAQIAALGGIETRLHDPVAEALEAGIEKLNEGLLKGAERGRWSEADAEKAAGLVSAAPRVTDLTGCDLVIEAAPEKLELKRELFAALAEACGDETVLATNTSSLPVTAIAAGAPKPERVVGMHFFNPPVRMELVEIVAGSESGDPALEMATEVARQMGRTPIRAADGPGFLANRLARPFGLEALRLLAENAGSTEEIDRTLRLGGGFRMGPFELADLIGLDVNFSVAVSFFEQSFGEPRWRPSMLQARMVSAGRLGRKTGRGWYDYSQGADIKHPDEGSYEPTVDEDELIERAGELAAIVVPRVAAQIANEAAFALGDRVGSPADMDTAMRLGFNWPLGPLEWAELIGPARAVGLLDELRLINGEAYRASPLLRRAAEDGIALRELA